MMRAAPFAPAGSAVAVSTERLASPPEPAITRGGPTGPASARLRLLLAAARHSVKLEAVPDQFVAELVGDDLLQLFDLFVAEFDDAAALQIDQVVVVVARHLLIDRKSVV